jgi:hypothetical protein
VREREREERERERERERLLTNVAEKGRVLSHRVSRKMMKARFSQLLIHI